MISRSLATHVVVICFSTQSVEPGGSVAYLKMLETKPYSIIRKSIFILQSVANAVALLYDIGALGADESLTRLGLHLASLPLSPTVAKMLLHAILFDCLDPALTVACGASYRDPFVLPVTLEQVGAAYESL